MDTMENEIRPCIDFLLETRFASGNFPSSLESDQDRLVQWCHGAPGFVHCLVAAAQVMELNNSVYFLNSIMQSSVLIPFRCLIAINIWQLQSSAQR